jgi:membrane associated rhomboid family serine protease
MNPNGTDEDDLQMKLDALARAESKLAQMKAQMKLGQLKTDRKNKDARKELGEAKEALGEKVEKPRQNIHRKKKGDRVVRTRIVGKMPWHNSTVTHVLLVVIVAVYLIQVQIGTSESVEKPSMVTSTLHEMFGGWCPCSGPTPFYAIAPETAEMLKTKQLWRIFTSMSMHGSVMHLLSNGASLYSCLILEASVGATRFLIIYLVSGIVGSIVSSAFLKSNSVGLGASGAIYGVLLVTNLVVVAPFHRRDIPVPSRGTEPGAVIILGRDVAGNRLIVPMVPEEGAKAGQHSLLELPPGASLSQDYSWIELFVVLGPELVLAVAGLWKTDYDEMLQLALLYALYSLLKRQGGKLKQTAESTMPGVIYNTAFLLFFTDASVDHWAHSSGAVGGILAAAALGLTRFRSSAGLDIGHYFFFLAAGTALFAVFSAAVYQAVAEELWVEEAIGDIDLLQSLQAIARWLDLDDDIIHRSQNRSGVGWKVTLPQLVGAEAAAAKLRLQNFALLLIACLALAPAFDYYRWSARNKKEPKKEKAT